MKKSNGKRNIVITAIILTFIIFFNQIPANADVTDNLQNSIAIILGHVDDTLGTSFEQSTTNGKLNQMKKVVDTLDTSMDQMISPYVGSLTLWVDSNSGTYAGQTVTVSNAKGQSQTGRFFARNGHYEVDFPSLIKGSYAIAYPYYLPSGKRLDLTWHVNVTGTVKQQLMGDIVHMNMSEIQQACKAGIINNVAHVGDTVSDGTYTYTVIGINQDKPSDADGNLLPADNYGDVLTLMPLGAAAGASNGTPVTMNAEKTPYGTDTEVMYKGDGYCAEWKNTRMRVTTMPQYLAKLPTETQKVIGYVQKITGIYNGKNDGLANSITGDKCFLLSGKEVFGEKGDGAFTSRVPCTENEMDKTFQYQYFADIATTLSSRNVYGTYWLRSPTYYEIAHCVNVDNGKIGNYTDYKYSYCVFPAFCIY